MALVTAAGVLALTGAFGSAATPASANQAQQYAGCTYSWGTPCYVIYEGINYLITSDPDHAATDWGSYPPDNHYKRPVADGKARDVCSTVMSHEGTLAPYGWTCNWGQVIETYPCIEGYAAIGTGVPYYGIALYQMIDFSEVGAPC